jgi:uncharacterized membrane protein YtjA (UPF0391 family)
VRNKKWDFSLIFAQESATNAKLQLDMLRYAVIFLIVAIIAAVLGFGGIAGAATGIAQVLFVVFIVLFLVSLVFGRRKT